MIPQRVSIEGFLSYRNQVEFFFDNAPIWMLTGKNGAGKSTVFDAITFALYGVHRGGKVNVEELINRRSDYLAVEFDFMLGDDCYRVRRAVPRQGGSVYQATHLRGPNSPNRSRSSPQPVPGTDSKAGLTQWVQRQLGLNEDAFKMAVLLEQGKSDALLSAKPAERHLLLSQLVDLSRYEALAARARDRQNEARLIVRHSKQELSELTQVSDAEITAQQAAVVTLKAQLEASQTHLEQLQVLMVYAKRWGDLCCQREEVLQLLEMMRALMADAEHIETSALRLEDLQTVLPILRRIFQHHEAQLSHQREATRYHQETLQFAAKLTEVAPLAEEAQQEAACLQQERDVGQDALDATLQRLHDLAIPIHQLDEMNKLRQQLEQCDIQLAKFAPDLDCQCRAAQEAVDELIHLKTLLPYVRRYSETRELWHKTCSQLESSFHQQAKDDQRVTDAVMCVQAADATLTHVREQLANLQNQKAFAEYELNTIRQQIARFGRVGDEPTCPYCGQPLSAEHLSSERARLDITLAENERKMATVASAENAALKAVQEAETRTKACEAEHQAALQAQRDCMMRCESLTHERNRLESEGWQALALSCLGKGFRFPLPKGAAIDLCFAEPEPTTDNLGLLKTRIQGYERAQATLRTLQQSVAARERHLTSRQQWDDQLQSFITLYPQDRVQTILSEHAAAEQAYKDIRDNLAQIITRLDHAQIRSQKLAVTLQSTRSSHQGTA